MATAPPLQDGITEGSSPSPRNFFLISEKFSYIIYVRRSKMITAEEAKKLSGLSVAEKVEKLGVAIEAAAGSLAIT